MLLVKGLNRRTEALRNIAPCKLVTMEVRAKVGIRKIQGEKCHVINDDSCSSEVSMHIGSLNLYTAKHCPKMGCGLNEAFHGF